MTSAEILGVSAEQRQMAAAQFERATDVLTSGNQEKEYAYKLLVTSCRLDPANVAYRKKLRQVGRELYERQGLSRWLGSVRDLPAKARLKAARHTGDHRKVLEYGEDILARSPEDLATHLAMGAAAGALSLPYLQSWLLEQACKQVPDSIEPLRQLAGAYERLKELEKAIAVWERVRKLDPADREAHRRINALSVKDTLNRSSYGS
jgi:tetratricopeptide (TPR) repeat protein